jgi:predicted MFS family arabinose efflux permease
LTGLTLAVAGSAYPGEAKHRAIGLLSGIQAATGVVGVPLLTALGAVIGWRLVFLLCGALATVAILPVARPLPPTVPHLPAPGARAMLGAYLPLLRDTQTARLYGVVALRSVCWGAMVTYFGAFLKEDANFSGRQVGLAYFLSSIIFFVACLAAGRARFWSPRARTAAGDLSMAVIVGILFVAPLSTIPLLMICTVSGASGAFGYVGVSGMLAEVATRRRTGAGITMSLGTALFSLGCAIGGIIGGALIAVGGYGLMGAVVPVFGVAAAVLAVAMKLQLSATPVDVEP